MVNKLRMKIETVLLALVVAEEGELDFGSEIT